MCASPTPSRSRSCAACPNVVVRSAPSPSCCPPASAPSPATAGKAARHDRTRHAAARPDPYPALHRRLADMNPPRSAAMVTPGTAGASAADEDRAHDTVCHLYDAECALHIAHQTHVEAWITAASRLRRHLPAVMPHSMPPRHRESPANDSTKEQRLMTTSLTAWPSTRDVSPPTDHLYRSATWLLGRHPRLALLAARIRGVVAIEDGELCGRPGPPRRRAFRRDAIRRCVGGLRVSAPATRRRR